MTTFQQINDFEFEDTYRPIRAKDGSWRDFSWLASDDVAAIEQARRENRLWTIIDFDGVVGLASGQHFVNRIGYVITEVIVPGDVCIDVLDPEENGDAARIL